GSTDGKLYAFPAQGCGSGTCLPVWTATTGGPIVASPTVGHGLVYVPSGDGQVHAYDAAGCGSSTCGDVQRYTMNGLTSTGSSVAFARIGAGMIYVGAGSSLLAYDTSVC